MSKKALKVLGITALLGLIGFLAYKSLKKCDTQTQTPEEKPITSSGSIGTGQYTNSGSIGTNPYGSSGSLGTNQYTSTFNTWDSNFSPSQFESLPTGLIFSYYDKVGIGSSGSIGTWRYIYKSAIGTSQYNNRWW